MLWRETELKCLVARLEITQLRRLHVNLMIETQYLCQFSDAVVLVGLLSDMGSREWIFNGFVETKLRDAILLMLIASRACENSTCKVNLTQKLCT